MKTLILELDNEYGMLKSSDEIDYYNYYNNDLLQKIVKRLKIRTTLFLGVWKKKLNQYDCVILFDRGFYGGVSRYIKQNNPNIKTILWLWNPVGERQEQFMNDEYIDEIWTYNENDAKKFNIKLNTQFYNKDYVKKCSKSEIHYDLMFIGFDKGRKDKIKEIEEKTKTLYPNQYIKIINNQSDATSYDEYLNILNQSKIILDIVNENVSGLTLRVLESIFFDKKLITNNESIEKYKFYNPNNIFIIKENNLNGLEEFMKKEYEKNDEDIVEYYEYKNWVKRFKSE